METLSTERVRGETARMLVEMCTTAVETDPCIPNIAYLLCGFDLTDLAGTRVENPGVDCFLLWSQKKTYQDGCIA